MLEVAEDVGIIVIIVIIVLLSSTILLVGSEGVHRVMFLAKQSACGTAFKRLMLLLSLSLLLLLSWLLPLVVLSLANGRLTWLSTEDGTCKHGLSSAWCTFNFCSSLLSLILSLPRSFIIQKADLFWCILLVLRILCTHLLMRFSELLLLGGHTTEKRRS